MNAPTPHAGGRYKGVRYFNGGLFSEPARIELYPDEVNQLKGAAAADWSKVSPEIFGTLFQHSMDTDERHAFGAHFTSAVDIMKIVKPTIVDPWTHAIESASSGRKLQDLLGRLTTLRVLDPACGSGNFLYLAYREMKRLESRIRERLTAEFPAEQPRLLHVNARQFFGLDINEFAIELAKVSMMIGRKLAVDELHIADENPLPLDNLDANFRAADALLDAASNRREWPKVDVIIGNPPFLDARKLTMDRGENYADALERAYLGVPGRADFCVYWFRHAHDDLAGFDAKDPLANRAGLVGTKSIRQNYSREGGLDYILKNGGTIVDAVAQQVWSGEANVHVSIVNWLKGPWNRPKQLATQLGDHRNSEWLFEEVVPIPSSLTSATDVTAAAVIQANRSPKVVFEGVQPGHEGFVITKAERDALLGKDARNDERIHLFLNGEELLTDDYKRDPHFLVDLSRAPDLVAASEYPDLLDVIKKRVLSDWPEGAESERSRTGRETGEHQNRLRAWWRLKHARGGMQDALALIPRYVCCSVVTKRPIFVFVDRTVRPSNLLEVFAFPDDYSFGVLQSSSHWTWFTNRCSTLTRRFRYTNLTVFDSFVWPQSPTKKQIDAVAIAGREVRRVREEAMKVITGGLRSVYRTLELPGKHPLKDAHAALDVAVLAAYGFSAKADLLKQLLDLNQAIAARERAGEPVTAPGVPAAYGDPAPLITDDCIRP